MNACIVTLKWPKISSNYSFLQFTILPVLNKKESMRSSIIQPFRSAAKNSHLLPMLRQSYGSSSWTKTYFLLCLSVAYDIIIVIYKFKWWHSFFIDPKTTKKRCPRLKSTRREKNNKRKKCTHQELKSKTNKHFDMHFITCCYSCPIMEFDWYWTATTLIV